MDLSTTYLGLTLPHPIVPGASPLADDIGTVRRLEDCGAPAIIMRSLFEEQLKSEELSRIRAMEVHSHAFAEAQTYFPSHDDLAFGPEEYLEQLRKVREAVSVPVIASLNGTTPGGWTGYAKLLEQAGAAAIELNVYEVVTDVGMRGEAVDQRVEDLVAAVRATVRIPVAVKLSPFYSSIPNVAARLSRAGAGALVLFNRFYQPDIDLEELELVRALRLSSSSELLLRLHWIALLWGRVKADLAITGGVHVGEDVIKATMAGASAVQVVSCLLEHGPEHLVTLRLHVSEWLERHEYESLSQARGSMSLLRCPDPHALQRGNYARILQSWRV